MTFLSTLLLSVLITIGLIPAFRALAMRWNIVDNPGGRKIHRNPIPRTGGLAMAVGAFVPIVLWNHASPFVQALLGGAAILVLFGVVDDCRDLSPKWKLVGQVAAALVVVVLGGIRIKTLGMLLPDGFILPAWISVPLTVVAIVGVTNAINLADGLDGLAGGICLLSFCTIGYLAWLEDDLTVGLVALAMAGAIYGFLRFNTFPATVFMGDAGSQLLGYSAITLSLGLTQGNTALSPVLPLLLLGFPILDTATVMAVRIAHGRSPFSADKNHLHHNLIALGLQQSESVIVIYACQSALILAAFMFRFHSDWLLLGGYLAFCTVTVAFLAMAHRFASTAYRADSAANYYFGSRFLRRMKEEGVVIRYAFPVLQYLLPLLLVAASLVPGPGKMPAYVSACALAFLVILAAVWVFKRDRMGDVLRFALYLMIPVVVYEGAAGAAGASKGIGHRLFEAAFGLVAFLDVLVSKLSKRREGFKSTPLDFLIIAIAVVVPNLPEQNLQAYNLGLVAAKTIILYFSFEVLMADMRGEFGRVALATGAALLAVTLKGVL